jgi:DNA-binding transcriptional MerR regulator
VRSLRTTEAARLLGVSPNTLRSWERKFGYPTPLRSAGGHRAYTYAEIAALRDALRRGLGVESAISAVREGLGADFEALVDALDLFNGGAGERAMEASLALRSMERSVEEVLLPALEEVQRRAGLSSTKWAFAHRFAMEWLSRAQRLSPPPVPSLGVLIGDATCTERNLSAPRILALELFCKRRGIAVLALPIEAVVCLPDALAALDPRCVVVAGGQASDEQVSRWAYAVRQIRGALPMALYLRPVRSSAPGLPTRDLPAAPAAAQHELANLIAGAGGLKQGAFADDPDDLTQLS